MLREDDRRGQRKVRKGFYQKRQENNFKKEDMVNDRYCIKSSSKKRQQICYLGQHTVIPDLLRPILAGW